MPSARRTALHDGRGTTDLTVSHITCPSSIAQALGWRRRRDAGIDIGSRRVGEPPRIERFGETTSFETREPSTTRGAFQTEWFSETISNEAISPTTREKVKSRARTISNHGTSVVRLG